MTRALEILIVDDDKALLGVLRSVLQAEGHRVEVALSAYEALPRLEQQRYDLVLVDLKMRRMDGLELLEHERLRERGARMVIMTAYPTVDSAVRAIREGAFDYLVKPFKLAELRALVARAAGGGAEGLRGGAKSQPEPADAEGTAHTTSADEQQAKGD